jgi:hypothetical protein
VHGGLGSAEVTAASSVPSGSANASPRFRRLQFRPTAMTSRQGIIPAKRLNSEVFFTLI